MLNRLYELLPQLPKLLRDEKIWDSLIINRRKPHTYRIFTQLGKYRVALHRFNPCDEHEAFIHPHPWAAAFYVLDGCYNMQLAYSKDRFSKPENVAKIKLDNRSAYEITNPLTWHSVIPITCTYTVMLNDEPWSPEIAHTEVRTTKGKDLEKMEEIDLSHSLEYFEYLLERIGYE